MSCWEPHIDVMRLLEALSTEIAATAEREVSQACAEARGSLVEAANEVRHLIGAVNGDLKEGDIDGESPGHHRSVTELGHRTCCRQH
jgi:hypothetical protein